MKHSSFSFGLAECSLMTTTNLTDLGIKCLKLSEGFQLPS